MLDLKDSRTTTYPPELIQLLLHLAHHLSRRDKRYPRRLRGQVGSRRDNVLLPHVADALADLADDLVEEGEGLRDGERELALGRWDQHLLMNRAGELTAHTSTSSIVFLCRPSASKIALCAALTVAEACVYGVVFGVPKAGLVCTPFPPRLRHA